LTDVRNQANTSQINKLLPSQGLQPKSHGARSPKNGVKGEESKGNNKKENSASDDFVWGP